MDLCSGPGKLCMARGRQTGPQAPDDKQPPPLSPCADLSLHSHQSLHLSVDRPGLCLCFKSEGEESGAKPNPELSCSPEVPRPTPQEPSEGPGRRAEGRVRELASGSGDLNAVCRAVFLTTMGRAYGPSVF